MQITVLLSLITLVAHKRDTVCKYCTVDGSYKEKQHTFKTFSTSSERNEVTLVGTMLMVCLHFVIHASRKEYCGSKLLQVMA